MMIIAIGNLFSTHECCIKACNVVLLQHKDVVCIKKIIHNSGNSRWEASTKKSIRSELYE